MTGLTAQTSAELESRASKAIPQGIVSLAEVTREHKDSVGTKAALLGELHAAGLPVVGGLVLCAETCKGLRAAKSLNPEQLSTLDNKIDALWPDCTTFAIRTSVIEGERTAQQNRRDTRCEYFVPRDALSIAIIAAASAPSERPYTQPQRKPVSSDGASDSSISETIDANEICDAIDRAVLVQPMVAAQVTGATFAGTLQAGSSESYLIESCWGLGRTLVEGQTDPDRYHLDSKDAVISRERGRKQRQLKGDGSGLLVGVDEEQRLEWTLELDQLKKVTTLAKRCATALGGTQDIEFAFTEEGLKLLQSRPVAAARLAPENVPSGKWVIALSQLENFAEPFTPLTEDLFRDALPDFAQMIHGRIYLDVEKLNQRLPLATTDDELTEVLLDRTPMSNAPFGAIKLLRCLPYWLSRSPWATAFWWRSRRLTGEQTNGFLNYAHQQANKTELDAQALFKRFVHGSSVFTAPWQLPFKLNLSSSRHLLYGALLDRLVKRWTNRSLADSTLQQLCANNADTLSETMATDITALAERVATTPLLKSVFESPVDGLSLHNVLNKAASANGSFANEFSTFVQRFGHRGAREFELASTRWLEEPKPLLAMIGMASRGAHEQAEDSAAGSLANEGYRLQLLARDDLHQSLGSRWQRRVIDHLVHRIRYWLSVRDNTRHHSAHALFIVRKKMLCLEDRLLQENKLKSAGDLFFLTWNDINYLDHGQLSPDDAATLIAAAKDQHAERSSRALRWTLGFDAAATKRHNPKQDPQDISLPQSDSVQDTTLDILNGRGAAPGEVEGLARIVTNERELTEFAPGEVLVLSSAEPTMAPAMQLASAVVCDCGGSMSYLSTLARVWGIPFVVGADNCTRAIATGERLKVNGATGRVTVLGAAGLGAALESTEGDEKKDPGGRGIWGEGDYRRGTEVRA